MNPKNCDDEKYFQYILSNVHINREGSNFHAEWKDWHTLEKDGKEKVK